MMRRALRVLGYGLAAAIIMFLLALGVFRVLGGRALHRDYGVDPAAPAAAESVSAGEAERIVRLRGCFGCHGTDLAGRSWFDEPLIARITTANLTEVARTYDDAHLARAIRHGIAADGRNLLEMPSDMFYHLSDRDVAAIIAAIRRAPPATDTLRPTRVGPFGYVTLATGKYRTAAALIDHHAPRLAGSRPDDLPEVRGRYLATTVCTECHGMNLQGGESVPALTIVAGYSEEAFRTLLRTGVPLDGRELGLMKTVALSRFAYFTDDEVAALYTYLRTLATGRPV